MPPKGFSKYAQEVEQQEHETRGYNTGINWLRPPMTANEPVLNETPETGSDTPEESSDEEMGDEQGDNTGSDRADQGLAQGEEEFTATAPGNVEAADDHHSPAPPQLSTTSKGKGPASNAAPSSHPTPGPAPADDDAADKPFACDQCGKAFKRKDHRDAHALTHGVDKPWLCPFPGCGRRYRYQTSLGQHMTTKGHRVGEKAGGKQTFKPAGGNGDGGAGDSGAGASGAAGTSAGASAGVGASTA